MLVVNAQSAANVQVLQVKALLSYSLDEGNHNDRRISKNINLCDCGTKMAMHAHKVD